MGSRTENMGNIQVPAMHFFLVSDSRITAPGVIHFDCWRVGQSVQRRPFKVGFFVLRSWCVALLLQHNKNFVVLLQTRHNGNIKCCSRILLVACSYNFIFRICRKHQIPITSNFAGFFVIDRNGFFLSFLIHITFIF